MESKINDFTNSITLKMLFWIGMTLVRTILFYIPSISASFLKISVIVNIPSTGVLVKKYATRVGIAESGREPNLDN